MRSFDSFIREVEEEQLQFELDGKVYQYKRPSAYISFKLYDIIKKDGENALITSDVILEIVNDILDKDDIKEIMSKMTDESFMQFAIALIADAKSIGKEEKK